MYQETPFSDQWTEVALDRTESVEQMLVLPRPPTGVTGKICVLLLLFPLNHDAYDKLRMCISKPKDLTDCFDVNW